MCIVSEIIPSPKLTLGSLIAATEVRKAAGTLKRTLPLAALQVGTLREREVPGTFQIKELYEMAKFISCFQIFSPRFKSDA